MNLTHIDLFAAADHPGTTMLLTNRGRPIEFETRRRQRADASAFVGASLRPGEWDVVVKLPDNTARDALIATLDGKLDEEFRLRATRNAIEVEAFAALRRLDLPASGLSARLTFEPTYPTWRATSPATSSDTLTSNDTVDVTVPGNTRVSPTVRIQPTAQRGGQTAAVGWKRRTRYRVTNNGDETLYRYPVRISLGSTTSIVSAGRAQADGDDVRVWSEGREVPRTLLGWNSSASYVWVIVPVLRPGRSLDFDIMWGNPDATDPPVLEYPDLPAFDLENSSNALWRYQVTAGKGAYYLSSGDSPPLIDQDVPGAWHHETTLANPDNTDDAAQYPYYVNSGDYSGPFYATRSLTATLALPNEGLADGISLHNPFGIESVSAAIAYLNTRHGAAGTPGVGKFVILTRPSGSQGWDKLFERSDESSVPISRTTYTPPSPVKNVAFAVWPFNELEVHEDTIFGRLITCRWSDYCDVAIDDDKLDISQVQADTEVYEVATVLSVDPGDGQTTAYELRLGAAGSTAEFDAPRLAVELDQVVVLDGTTRTASVWDSTLENKVEDVPNFAVRAIRKAPVLGQDEETPTHLWLVLKPDPDGAELSVAEVEMGTLAVTVVVYGEWVP